MTWEEAKALFGEALEDGTLSASLHTARTMDTAPKDGTPFLTYSADFKRCGLSPFFSICAWHEDAGFCTDEIREPIFWWPLPEVKKGV